MRVVVVGAYGAIGGAVVKALSAEHDVALVGRGDAVAKQTADALVCCNGSHGSPIGDVMITTLDMVDAVDARIVVTMSGGAVGGAPAVDVPSDYFAAKAGIAAWTEWAARMYRGKQFFCVAPGPTRSKMNPMASVRPEVPAAFIVKLLSGKYGHLSGSLLAAQRDDLDTMKPMKLRRVECL